MVDRVPAERGECKENIRKVVAEVFKFNHPAVTTEQIQQNIDLANFVCSVSLSSLN